MFSKNYSFSNKNKNELLFIVIVFHRKIQSHPSTFTSNLSTVIRLNVTDLSPSKIKFFST